MIVENSGNPQILREKVVLAPVRRRPYGSPPTKRMRGLPLEAGVQYGLLTSGTYEATELAKELAKLQDPQIYQMFARHILLNLNGLRVVEAIQEMELDHKTITGDSLAQYLTDQGFRVTVHNTAINTMRMWLAEAGLFPKAKKNNEAWIPDREVKKKLMGMDDEVIAALAGLSPEQVAFCPCVMSLRTKRVGSCLRRA